MRGCWFTDQQVEENSSFLSEYFLNCQQFTFYIREIGKTTHDELLKFDARISLLYFELLSKS